MLEVESIEGFEPATEYPHAKALTGGTRRDRGGAKGSSTGGGMGVFKVVDSAIKARASSIDVRLSAPVTRLLSQAGEIAGVRADIDGESRDIIATRGVFSLVDLLCPRHAEQYWQISPVLSSACRGNTGDGVRMAQAVGADLAHVAFSRYLRISTP